MLPCVVLAGGLGTRMRPMTERIPKSLIPVLGRPFAEIQLEWLAAKGVDHVIYCVGYRGGMVESKLGDGERFGLRIVYVDEGDDLRGTAGALRLALDERVLPEAFFVLNGGFVSQRRSSCRRVSLDCKRPAGVDDGVP